MSALALCAVLLGAAPLTPDDAVRIALDHSGALAAARFAAQKGAVERELHGRDPRLRLGHNTVDGLFGTPHTDGNGDPYAFFDGAWVEAIVPLPSPREALAPLGNDAATAADDADVEDTRRTIAAKVRALHAELSTLREESALAEKGLAILQRLEAQTGERLAAEATTALDARLAMLDRIDAAADAEDVRADAARVEHELASLVGLPAPLALAPPPHPVCARPVEGVDALLVRAKKSSPVLRALAARRDRAHVEASVAWTRLLPYPSRLALRYTNEPLDKRDEWRAYLELTLPLFEPLTGRWGEPSLEERRLAAESADAERALEAQVKNDYDRLTGALALVSLYAQSEKSIEEGLKDVERALAAGQADVFRAAEVQARAVAAQRSALHARSRCEAAAIDLARLTGDVGAP